MSVQEFIWPVNIPFEETLVFNTLVTSFEDGKEQRRQKWSQPKRVYDVSIKGRSDVIMQQIWDFYTARAGAYDTFYFENPNESPVTGEAIGTGNGTSTAYSLDHYPLPSGAITITVGGVAKTETTDYTLTRSTGAISFNIAPTSGDAILGTYDFCRIVRFAEDNLSREMFNYKLFNSSIKFVEVLS